MNETLNYKMRLGFGVTAVLAVVALWAAPVRAQGQDSDKLTLRQAVTMAMQNSRDIALARMQYTVALNAAGVDRADFRPNLYTGSGAAYTSGFPSTVGGQAPSIFNLSYTQSVFNLPLRGQLKAAEDRAARPENRTRPDARRRHRPHGLHLPGTCESRGTRSNCCATKALARKKSQASLAIAPRPAKSCRSKLPAAN